MITPAGEQPVRRSWGGRVLPGVVLGMSPPEPFGPPLL